MHLRYKQGAGGDVIMNDEDGLKLLIALFRNLREATVQRPRVWWGSFKTGIENLSNISEYISNDKLRACALYLNLHKAILNAYVNKIFKDSVFDAISSSPDEEPDKELLLIIVSESLTVGALSDGEGRDVVHMINLKDTSKEILKDLDPQSQFVVLLKLSKAIRKVSNSFIAGMSGDFTEFYDEITKSQNWNEVFISLDRNLTKFDKILLAWKRSKETQNQ